MTKEIQVINKNGKLYTTSLNVADVFEKDHKTIKIITEKSKNKLRKIVNIFLNKLVILIPLYSGIC